MTYHEARKHHSVSSGQCYVRNNNTIISNQVSSKNKVDKNKNSHI